MHTPPLSRRCLHATASNSGTLANGLAKIQVARQLCFQLHSVEEGFESFQLLEKFRTLHTGSFVTNFDGRTLPASVFMCFQNTWATQSLPLCRDYVSDESRVTCSCRRAHGAFFFYASLAMVFVAQSFHVRKRNKCVKLNVWINPTLLTCTRTEALVLLICQTFFRWGAIARSFHGRTMFGPVMTREDNSSFAGANVHSVRVQDPSRRGA